MTTNFTDTVCAPATSVGTGAVSIIRTSGPESLAIIDKVVRFRSGSASASKGYILKYGEIPEVDEVVVGIYRAPHSYTGEDSAEICCHASPYIVSRILELLTEAGCRMAEAGEFTRRAFVNGKMDLAQAEAVADVIAASSQAQHRVAMNQLRGGYSAELGKIRAELLELTSLMELELDFSEEDVEFADRSRLSLLLDDASARCSSLAESFRIGNAIRNGVPTAIVGAPNSGKSTLLNALLHDDRAIVSDVPGTTRDTVEETCVIGGVLFRFIDTAGIRETADKVEKLGIQRSFNKAAEAEIVLGVVDATAQPEQQIEKIAAMVDLSRQKLVVLLNKCDKAGIADACCQGSTNGPAEDAARCPEPVTIGDSTIRKQTDFVGNLAYNKNVIDANNIVKSIENKYIGAKALCISAKTGEGLDKLRELLAEMVGKVAAESVMVTNARHAAALSAAAQSLRTVQSGLASSLPSDLLAEDLREALRSLGSITGEITTDEVLGEIFAKFCIGK